MKAGTVIALLLAVAALGGLYVAMKPGSDTPSKPASVAAPAPEPATEPVAEYGKAVANEFAITVAGGRVTAGPATLRAMQGAPVVIRVTSDRNDELHLHGYELGLPLKAGVPGALAFTADKAGRFDLELHQANLELGALEVQPK